MRLLWLLLVIWSPQLNISPLAMQLGTVVHHALNQLLFIHHCKLGLALSQQVSKGEVDDLGRWLLQLAHQQSQGSGTVTTGTRAFRLGVGPASWKGQEDGLSASERLATLRALIETPGLERLTRGVRGDWSACLRGLCLAGRHDWRFCCNRPSSSVYLLSCARLPSVGVPNSSSATSADSAALILWSI